MIPFRTRAWRETPPYLSLPDLTLSFAGALSAPGLAYAAAPYVHANSPDAQAAMGHGIAACHGKHQQSDWRFEEIGGNSPCRCPFWPSRPGASPEWRLSSQVARSSSGSASSAARRATSSESSRTNTGPIRRGSGAGSSAALSAGGGAQKRELFSAMGPC